MNIAIIGLGLIGGSFAKAYKTKTGNRVFGADKDRETLSYAMLSETIDGLLTDENISECELVILALYPDATPTRTCLCLMQTVRLSSRKRKSKSRCSSP